MQSPFTLKERNAILKQYFREYRWFTEDHWLRFFTYLGSYSYEFVTIKGKMPKLEQQYMERVPILPLSRCPFCDTVNFLSIDYYDIDGLWWNSYHRAKRPHERESRCLHYHTLSGALRLAETINYPPFQVYPGPEVPFVIPAIFKGLGWDAKVVISQLTIGLHTGYPIVYYLNSNCSVSTEYYSRVSSLDFPRFPEWGNGKAVYFINGSQCENEESVSGSSLNKYFLPHHFFSGKYCEDCFDLAQWIQQERVYWIAPNDESLTLRNDIESCPYLNLPGERKVALLNRGKVCWPDARGFYG